MFKKLLLMIALPVWLTACGAGHSGDASGNDSTANPQDSITKMKPTTDKYVEIKTTMGDIVVKLYGDTPAHQANFLKLVNEGYYDSVMFHRVINEFMVQTGDPDSRHAAPGQSLGSGGPGYQIDAEILYPRHFHKRGALAAARSGDEVNPERKSSGSQFYIVTGRKVTDAEMQTIVNNYAFQEKQEEFNRLAQGHMEEIRKLQMEGKYKELNDLRDKLIAEVEAKFANSPVPQLPQEIADAYRTEGGTPHLDGAYTVFGEVVSGMDVVEKIEKAQTDSQDRPVEDIRIISTKVVEAPATK